MVDTINTALNLIVLTYDEEVLRWLDPDLAEIKETSTKDKCRKIEITYPLYEEYLESENNWYDQGHKIYIPSISGITNCLYVINTSYEIDYLEKNHIRVEAEEVMTEMNYDYVGFVNTQDVTTEVQVEKGKIKQITEIGEDGEEYPISRIYYYKEYITVTAEVLRELLGNYYDIETIELSENNKQITPAGTMSYMSLLRLIEEQTERRFFTTYINYENTITRRLSLLDTSKVRHVAQTEYLDLNYNLASLELEISEENTYNAMAPEFSNSTTMTAEGTTGTTTPTIATPTSTAQLVTNAENVAQPTTTSKDDLASIIDNWINYEVQYRQEVPMIIKEDEQKNLVTSATWYAPFEKRKNRLYIEVPYNTGDSRYNTIQDYQTKITRAKIGKVSTSETIPEMIYNTLAKSLLEKLTPDFELKISVKDIQMLLGQSNLGYQLFETLYVRIPNFDYYVPCQITETVKNLHLPGENTIKVEANVGSRLNMKDTMITSHDVTMLPGQKNTISGMLTTTENEPLANQMITVNIRLKETVVGEYVNGYLETGEQVTKFDSKKGDIITIPTAELSRLQSMWRYELVHGNPYTRSYVVRTTNNKLYELGWGGALYTIKAYLRLQAVGFNDVRGSSATTKGTTDIKMPFLSSMTIQYITKPPRLDEYDVSNWTWTQWVNNAGILYSQYYDGDDEYAKEYQKLTKAPIAYLPWGITQTPWRSGDGSRINAYISMVLWVYAFYLLHESYELVCQNILDKIVPAVANEKLRYCASYLRNDGFSVTEIPFTESGITNTFQKVNIGCVVGCLKSDTEDHVQHVLISKWDRVDGKVYVSYLELDNGNVFKIGLFSELKSREKYYDMPALLILPPSNITKPSEIQPIKVHIPLKTASVQDVVPYSTESIQKAINTAYETQSKNTQLDLMTISVPTQNTSEKNVSITLKQLRGLAYASMLTYHTSDIETTKQNIYFGEGSEAKKYYEHFGTEYDFFTPCNPRYSSYRPHYIVSTALFNLGIIRSYRDFFTSKKDMELTFNDIMGEVNNLIPGGEVKMVEASEANLRANVPKQLQHVFMREFVVAYGKASVLNLNSNYDETVHPLLIYGIDGDTVRYQNISGKGNSPTDQYDTTIATKGTANPWQTCSMATMLGWISNAREQAPSGDGGMLLVFKRTK